MWFPSSEIKHRWDGLLVCSKDWETRHPQTLIRIKGETAFPSFVSKDKSPDEFVLVCGIDGVSGFADLGTADCAQADKDSPSYLVLSDLKKNGHE